MPNTATVSFKLTPHETAALQLLALQQGVSVSHLCRGAVRQALHTQERVHDLISVYRNIGSVYDEEDGPLPDLGPEFDPDFLRAALDAIR